MPATLRAGNCERLRWDWIVLNLTQIHFLKILTNLELVWRIVELVALWSFLVSHKDVLAVHHIACNHFTLVVRYNGAYDTCPEYHEFELSTGRTCRSSHPSSEQ